MKYFRNILKTSAILKNSEEVNQKSLKNISLQSKLIFSTKIFLKQFYIILEFQLENIVRDILLNNWGLKFSQCIL